MKIAVLGAGSWGTAIAGLLAQKHKNVVLWARNKELIECLFLHKENRVYLPDVKLPQTLTYSFNIVDAVRNASFIVLVTPSHALRQTVQTIRDAINPETILISASKGLETQSLKRMSEIIQDELPFLKFPPVALSGPNHAEEVGRLLPTTTVAASASREAAEAVQDLFISPYFRVYTNPDIIGVELGGALKNIIALGAGIADGLELGDNSKAALMTRGLTEISRLGIAMKANALTFAGLSGIGDLMVTCTSRHSRNRRAGILIAQGKSVEEVEEQTNMVVEGIRSTLAAYRLSRQHAVEMPITEQIYQVLYEKKSPKDAVLDLMMRSRTHEVEEVATDTNWNNC